MSYGGTDTEGGFTSINVTPLTDVMLVLLITFLLSASSFDSSSLTIPLPQVIKAQDIEKHALILPVDLEGRVEWPEANWQDSAPRENFERLLKSSSESILALAVHRDNEYGDIFPLLEQATAAGWPRTILLTTELTL